MVELEESYKIDILAVFNRLQRESNSDEEVLENMEAHLYGRMPRPIRESLITEIKYYLRDM